MESELTEEILNLRPGDHLCLFYEKDPGEQMPALVPFIQDALSRDEQLIYIADDQTVEELRGRLQESGINVGKECDRGALKLWTRREWRQPGNLSSEKKTRQVLEFIHQASQLGFKGSRFAVEMTWILGPDIGADRLEHWEATLNTIFVPGFSGRIVCQYNRSRLAPGALLAALHTHPLAILGDHVYPNLFYQAPLILNGNAKSNSARVQWMISVLERSRITQREREELIEKRAALTEAELAKKRTEDILSLMPAGVYTCDEQGRITFFNRQAAEIWGREPALNDDVEKFNGAFRLWRLDGSLMNRDETPMAIALTTGQSVRNREVVVGRPDGSRMIIRVNIDPLCDPDRRPGGAINVFQDVTELKKTEEAKQRLAAIIESSDDAIISKDLNGIITSWNPGAERIFGYRDTEIIGKPVTLLIPTDRQDEEPVILARIRRGERVEHYETIRQRKDGSLINISLTVSPIKDAEGKVIGASKIARDITRRKQMEVALDEARDAFTKELQKRVEERTAELELANLALRNEMEEHEKLEQQLWQAQKMESLGTLAGGIAHDFNNILNIIKGYALLIRQNPSVGENVAEDLHVIEETIERGAFVVRQLLTLARKTETRLVLTNPDSLLLELSKLLKQTFPKTIDIGLERDTQLPPIWVDPNQINQALLNLSVNARDAMSGAGRLILKTSVVGSDKVHDPVATAERYVCIEMKDTGAGMDAAVRNRIFEPFFTTKRAGEGTGLGLAIVYGIVKSHNGFINVDSELGRGTTFRLYFPVAPSEQKRPVDELPQSDLPAANERTNGKGTVLVVEDEENMVYLLRKALLRHKCGVFVALDGEQAIDLYQRHKQDIDVVLLDIGLPKLSGWDIIPRMKQENPNIRVFVTSGYLEPDLKFKLKQAGVQGFIEKPYTPDDVVQMLWESPATP
jgi:PAS domain S-box-containing protein